MGEAAEEETLTFPQVKKRQLLTEGHHKKRVRRKLSVNRDAIGAVGELFGATATVVMLVYLSSQIHHAREATQSSTEIEASKLLTRLTERVAENLDLQRIWNDVSERRQDIPEQDSSHLFGKWEHSSTLQKVFGSNFRKG